MLAEVSRRAGAQPLCALPLLPGVHVLFLLGEQQRRRYVDAKKKQAGPGSASRTWAATQRAPAVGSDVRRGVR
jgi:hypothetical protein